MATDRCEEEEVEEEALLRVGDKDSNENGEEGVEAEVGDVIVVSNRGKAWVALFSFESVKAAVSGVLAGVKEFLREYKKEGERECEGESREEE
jgi:hypothetical protein